MGVTLYPLVPPEPLPLTAFGDLRVAELSPIYQGSFEYTVDNTDLNTNTVVAGGTVTQGSAMAVVGSSTTTASTAMFQSKQHSKYRPGLGGMQRFTALFTSPVAATEQYIGLADETGSSAAFKNGYMVGYDGTTFGFHRFQNDVKTTTALANWTDPLDGTGPSGMTLDQTKLNVFFIQFEYLGGGPINICMADDDSSRVHLVHTEDYANAFTSPSVHNPNFHHTMWVNNKATTNDIVLKGASYSYFVEGKTSLIELHQPQFSTGEQTAASVTAEAAIVTIRSKALYASRTNFIDVLMQNTYGSIEASAAQNLGSIRLVHNAVITSPSYSDINTSNSVIEVDTTGTISGGTEIFTLPLAGKNDKELRDLVDLRIILNPGDTITLAGSSVGTATIKGGMLWRELF